MYRGNLETLLMSTLVNLTSDLFKCTDYRGERKIRLVFLLAHLGQQFRTAQCSSGRTFGRTPSFHPTEVYESSVFQHSWAPLIQS